MFLKEAKDYIERWNKEYAKYSQLKTKNGDEWKKYSADKMKYDVQQKLKEEYEKVEEAKEPKKPEKGPQEPKKVLGAEPGQIDGDVGRSASMLHYDFTGICGGYLWC